MVVVAGAMVVTGAADVDGTDDRRSNVSQLAVCVCGAGAVAVVGAGKSAMDTVAQCAVANGEIVERLHAC